MGSADDGTHAAHDEAAGGGRETRRGAQPGRLAALAKRAERIKGSKKARSIIPFLCAKSASVKETEMGALLLTPMRRGGLGLPPALANEPVARAS